MSEKVEEGAWWRGPKGPVAPSDVHDDASDDGGQTEARAARSGRVAKLRPKRAQDSVASQSVPFHRGEWLATRLPVQYKFASCCVLVSYCVCAYVVSERLVCF